MAIKRAGAAEINFGDLAMYVAGGGLPEGDYALEFNVVMHQAEKDGVAKGPARLGVMVSAYPLKADRSLGGEMKEQFYSMGSKAHESFAPNPDTGKGLVAVPGGSASTFNNKTNWAYFLTSLENSGLPKGIFVNDISVLDGVWVHVTSIPEPEDRKGFATAKTAEVAEEPRKNGTIAVVSEILPNGAPWEGGGGIPAAAPVDKAAPVVKGKPVIAAKAAVKPAPAKAPVAAGLSEEEVREAAEAGITAVLEKNPDGLSKLLLRTKTFASVTELFGDEAAQSVIDSFFGGDEELNSVLEGLGYKVAGSKVAVAT